jgi:hypothetical protein
MAPVPAPTLQQLVIANWLAQEIDAQAEENMPALREIRGWRRRDVLTRIGTLRTCWRRRSAVSAATPRSPIQSRHRSRFRLSAADLRADDQSGLLTRVIRASYAVRTCLNTWPVILRSELRGRFAKPHQYGLTRNAGPLIRL